MVDSETRGRCGQQPGKLRWATGTTRAHSAYYWVLLGAFSPMANLSELEAHHSLISSGDIKNAWNFTSDIRYAFFSCHFDTQRPFHMHIQHMSVCEDVFTLGNEVKLPDVFGQQTRFFQDNIDKLCPQNSDFLYAPNNNQHLASCSLGVSEVCTVIERRP